MFIVDHLIRSSYQIQMPCNLVLSSNVATTPAAGQWCARWRKGSRALVVLVLMVCTMPEAGASKFSHWVDVHLNPARGPQEVVNKSKEAAEAATNTFAETGRLVLLVKWPLFAASVSLALWMTAVAISSWMRLLAGLRWTETPLTPRAVRWGIAAWIPWVVGIALPVPAFAERDAALRGLLGLGMLFALRGAYLCARPHASKTAQVVAILLNLGYILLMVI